MARSLGLPATRVRILSPEDNLLQVALHTAKHTYVRAPGFRLHTDVDRVVFEQSIDWELFAARVEQLSVRTPVYFSLALAHRLLGTPIPLPVLERLRPSRWKERLILNWLGRVGLFDPDEPKFGPWRYLAFTALQYDSWGGLLGAALPPPARLREKYCQEASAGLPILYAKYLRDLAFRRNRT